MASCMSRLVANKKPCAIYDEEDRLPMGREYERFSGLLILWDVEPLEQVAVSISDPGHSVIVLVHDNLYL